MSKAEQKVDKDELKVDKDELKRALSESVDVIVDTLKEIARYVGKTLPADFYSEKSEEIMDAVQAMLEAIVKRTARDTERGEILLKIVGRTTTALGEMIPVDSQAERRRLFEKTVDDVADKEFRELGLLEGYDPDVVDREVNTVKREHE